jgi:hypothetical protein
MANKTKHTAGEWNRACDSYGKVQHSRKYDCVYTHVKGNGGDRIITVAARIENGRDADLIAAAPELLESCKLGLSTLRMYRNPTREEKTAITTFAAAIDKAEGR